MRMIAPQRKKNFASASPHCTMMPVENRWLAAIICKTIYPVLANRIDQIWFFPA
jgi:hypothetical protein